MIIVKIMLKDYSLSILHLQNLAEEFYFRPLTNEENAQIVELGCEELSGENMKTEFLHALEAFRR